MSRIAARVRDLTPHLSKAGWLHDDPKLIAIVAVKE